MSSEYHEVTYTCDMCGKTPLTHDEVADITITFVYPDRWNAEAKGNVRSVATFDACRSCLGTRRASNPSVQFEDAVVIDDNDARDGLGVRLIRWILGVTDV